jgi:hypothetical protein
VYVWCCRRLGPGALVFEVLVTTKLLVMIIGSIVQFGMIVFPIMFEYQKQLNEIHKATHGAMGEGSGGD